MNSYRGNNLSYFLPTLCYQIALRTAFLEEENRALREMLEELDRTNLMAAEEIGDMKRRLDEAEARGQAAGEI